MRAAAAGALATGPAGSGARRRRMRNSPTSSTSELNDDQALGARPRPAIRLYTVLAHLGHPGLSAETVLRTQVCLTSLRIALQVYDSFSKTKIIGWARPEDAPEPDQVHPAPWMI